MNTAFILSGKVGELFSTGGITTLIGLGMTFLVLALLIGCIYLLRVILKFLEKKYPKLIAKIKNAFKKKKNVNVEEIATDDNVRSENPITDEVTVDETTRSIIDETVQLFVNQSDVDGKPHNNIKIISVEPIDNESTMEDTAK